MALVSYQIHVLFDLNKIMISSITASRTDSPSVWRRYGQDFLNRFENIPLCKTCLYLIKFPCCTHYTWTYLFTCKYILNKNCIIKYVAIYLFRYHYCLEILQSSFEMLSVSLILQLEFKLRISSWASRQFFHRWVIHEKSWGYHLELPDSSSTAE